MDSLWWYTKGGFYLIIVLFIADIVEEEIDDKTTNLTFYIGTIGELKVVTTIQFQWEKRENGSFKLIGIF